MPINLPPPPPETEASIVQLVVRAFPQGGPQHERAIRMALQLGWFAGFATTAQLKETING